MRLFIVGHRGRHPENPVFLLVKTVVADFILGVKKNEHATSQPDTESGDVDEREYLVAPDIPESDFEVIAEHRFIRLSFIVFLKKLYNPTTVEICV